MPSSGHPVDAYSDLQLFALMQRIDTDGFPARLEDVWRAERVRFRETLRRIPRAASKDAAILDLGASRAWLPFFQVLLGYKNVVLNTSYPDAGFVCDRLTAETDLPPAQLSIFNVEREEFPFDDASFDVVTCLEVLEHLAIDPMAMMAEVNRVLKPGGRLVLTTPNAIRTANLVNAFLGEQPCGWNPYNGFDTNRHNREYTPRELDQLLAAAGMETQEVTTFGAKSRGTLRDLLACVIKLPLTAVPGCPLRHRRDVILVWGTKINTILDRRPKWLYFDMAERKERCQDDHARKERDLRRLEQLASTNHPDTFISV
jgi:SAM-dependent methyltransferase